jgi:hypothetical protein
LLVTTADRDLLDGGSIHLFLSAAADGVHLCRPLWRQLAEMGVR